MISACYDMALYCDVVGLPTPLSSQPQKPRDNAFHHFDEFPWHYTAEHGATARKQARRAGWKFDYRSGKAICPRCAKRGVKLKDIKTMWGDPVRGKRQA